MTQIKLNLQFFQGEKTEKATPKKRKDARDKGQVVQSKDLGSATSLLLIILFITFFNNLFMGEMYHIYYRVMDYISNPKAADNLSSLSALSFDIVFSMFKIILPILGIALLSGVLLSYLQVGFLFTLEPIKFKFDKISPIKGFQRLFSLKALVEMVKSILKASGVVLIAYLYINSRIGDLMNISTLSLEQSIVIMWSLVYNIVLRIGIYLFIIAVFDYAYKRWDNEKQLRMSKQEIKEEYKQMEGDPFIKSKIKEKQRQMAMSRMMQEVPGADVVITNPTHYAVALRYDRDRENAPVVVAKGKDLIAKNIKKTAEENAVPIVENKPLARSLYSAVDINETIPSDLFEAVADVLAYVYRLKNRSV